MSLVPMPSGGASARTVIAASMALSLTSFTRRAGAAVLAAVASGLAVGGLVAFLAALPDAAFVGTVRELWAGLAGLPVVLAVAFLVVMFVAPFKRARTSRALVTMKAHPAAHGKAIPACFPEFSIRLTPESAMAEHDLEALTHAQQQSIFALLAEPSIAAAAAKAGVGERTLHRWLRQEVFGSVYRDSRREAFIQAIGLTQRSAAAAVATLLRIMHDPKATWSARVAAATNVLRFARESIELDDLAERLIKLEKATQQEDQP